MSNANKVIFTVNTTPSDAKVVLKVSNDIVITSGQKVSVRPGTIINYTVSATGYHTQTGTITVDSDTEINIYLSEIVVIYYDFKVKVDSATTAPNPKILLSASGYTPVTGTTEATIRVASGTLVTYRVYDDTPSTQYQEYTGVKQILSNETINVNLQIPTTYYNVTVNADDDNSEILFLHEGENIRLIGSPVLKNDLILKNFSVNNYASGILNLPATSINSFEVVFKIHILELQPGIIYNVYDKDNSVTGFYIEIDNNYDVFLKNGIISCKATTAPLTRNTTCWLKWEYNVSASDNKLYGKYSNDGSSYFEAESVSITQPTFTEPNFALGMKPTCMVKLDDNNNLILKAGSKIAIPNGINTYNTVDIANNLTISPSGATNGIFYVFINNTGTSSVNFLISDYEERSDWVATSTNRVVYNTLQNQVKYTTDGGLNWSSLYSKPIAKVIKVNSVYKAIILLYPEADKLTDVNNYAFTQGSIYIDDSSIKMNGDIVWDTAHDSNTTTYLSNTPCTYIISDNNNWAQDTFVVTSDIVINQSVTPASGTIVFESNTPGNYYVNIPETKYYDVHLVGGGGGGLIVTYIHFNILTSGSIGSGFSGGSARKQEIKYIALCSGGSGAYSHGKLYITKGTYLCTVGHGGSSATFSTNGARSGNNGSDTIAFNNCAGGGFAGAANIDEGSSKVVSYINKGLGGYKTGLVDGNDTTFSLMSSINGNSGNTFAVRTKNKNENSYSIFGGNSVYGNYGKGGDANMSNVTLNNGGNGYIKIVAL